MLYPLKFKTIFKDKIWGGSKINDILEKDFSPLPNCGETWEVSGVKGNISVVKEGHLEGKELTTLIEEYKGELVGNAVFQKFGTEFPLLIKFIDANNDLSVQVHPDDVLAKERHNSFGKTEMWYVFQADEGSSLVSGFNKTTNKEEYLEKLNSGNLYDILNVEKVKADDVFFLPAGRVHTIGKGLLIAEIQQTSDITYRIYDFDRRDAQGNTRELHTEEAIDAIDYNAYDEYKSLYESKKNEAIQLVTCNYFETNKLHFDQISKRDYSSIDSFVIHICMEGKYTLKSESGDIEVFKGDSILLPASINNVELVPQGEFKILETYVP